MKNSTRELLILKYMLDQTDENHFVTIADINEFLAEQNLIGDRKTINSATVELVTEN